MDEALDAYRRGVHLSGGAPFMKAFLATAYVDSGDRQAAEDLLSDLLDGAQRSSGSGLFLAIAAEALGEEELALDWLERAYAGREMMVVVLQISGFLPFASLRGNPRFEALVDQVGIAPHDISGERERLLQRAGGA